jgi:hypothetical protein
MDLDASLFLDFANILKKLQFLHPNIVILANLSYILVTDYYLIKYLLIQELLKEHNFSYF